MRERIIAAAAFLVIANTGYPAFAMTEGMCASFAQMSASMARARNRGVSKDHALKPMAPTDDPTARKMADPSRYPDLGSMAEQVTLGSGTT